jgi:radical SAM protein with 4Fe4S-binding SPASM domain
MERLAHVDVSIDSPDPEVYLSIRGGNVKRALRGLENLMAAMPKPKRTLVSVSAVALRDNLDSLNAFPSLLSRLGVGSFVLQGSVDYNSYSRDQYVGDREDLAWHLESLRAACKQHRVDLVLTMPARMAAEETQDEAGIARFITKAGGDVSRSRQCLLPWEVPYIDKDGRVFPCCYAGAEGTVQLGDVRDNDFDEIWLGEPYQRFRRSLLQGLSLEPICQRCTGVAIGRHPLAGYQAMIEPEQLDISDRRVRVTIRNTGSRTWTSDDHIRIGTTAPRDCASRLWHSTWLSRNRACSFNEPRVGPGQEATFTFLIGRHHRPAHQEFQAVADGVCWLPNTRFSVTLGQTGMVHRYAMKLAYAAQRASRGR